MRQAIKDIEIMQILVINVYTSMLNKYNSNNSLIQLKLFWNKKKIFKGRPLFENLKLPFFSMAILYQFYHKGNSKKNERRFQTKKKYLFKN